MEWAKFILMSQSLQIVIYIWHSGSFSDYLTKALKVFSPITKKIFLKIFYHFKTIRPVTH